MLVLDNIESPAIPEMEDVGGVSEKKSSIVLLQGEAIVPEEEYSEETDTSFSIEVRSHLQNMQNAYKECIIELVIKNGNKIIIYFCTLGRNPVCSLTYFEKPLKPLE